MTTITGQTTMSTNVTGDSLCPLDSCHPNPCMNLGSCSVAGTGSDYTCTCLVGYTGVDCSEDINECLESSKYKRHNLNVYNMCISFFVFYSTATCLNNGVCINIPGAYICNCTEPGVFGDVCEFVLQEGGCDCPSLYTCVSTEGSSPMCQNFAAGGLMIAQDPAPANTAVLDQVINTLNEDEPVSEIHALILWNRIIMK